MTQRQSSVTGATHDWGRDSGPEAILERIGVGVLRIADDVVVWANNRASEISGYDRSALDGVAFEDLFEREDDAEAFRRLRRKILVGEPSGHLDVQLRRSDGLVTWVRLRGSPASMGTSGADTLWTLDDVTDEREAMDELRLADAIFESSTEGILVCDTSNRIVAVNPAFNVITGYERDEVIGRHPDFLNSDLHEAAFFEEIWLVLERDGRWDGEVWHRRKNGETFPEWLSVVPVRGQSGTLEYYVAMFSDITKRKQDEERINFQANYDALTNLPNRRMLRDRIDRALARALHIQSRMSVLYLDLDNFKFVNDSLGHGVGDILLVDMARRMKSCLREHDTIGRLGGDEFLVVLPHINNADETSMVAKRLLEAVAQPISLKGRDHDIVVTTSIGISIFPDDGDTADDLIRNADTAAFHAKEVGRNTFQYFTDDMNVRATERLNLENRLRRALERDELVLHYQPKVELRHGRIVGVEALVRWANPEEGLVPPAKFIPLAEETGLIVPIGEWVMRTACEQAKRWQDSGLPMIQMAVNMSARQLSKDGIYQDIVGILEQTGLDPKYFELEITESSLMERADIAIAILRDLREMGVHLTADDFGTGYSSLNYLRTFPLDALKIDRAFVSDIGGDGGGAMLAAAVIAIGQSLNLRVIAEGVETPEQLSFLRQQWCDEIQGYYFSRPLPASEFEALLRSNRRL